MAFLNKGVVLAGLLIAGALTVEGQGFERQLNAFRNSYHAESQKDYSTAVAALKEVYSEGSYELNLRLGWLTHLQENYAESAAYYRKAVSLMPYGLEARFGLAYPLAKMGNSNELTKLYEQILEIDPANTIALYNYGLLLYNQDNHLKAEKLLTKVVNLYPFDYDSVVLLGWIKLKLGKSIEAKGLFQKALLYSPDDNSAKLGLSQIR